MVHSPTSLASSRHSIAKERTLQVPDSMLPRCAILIDGAFFIRRFRDLNPEAPCDARALRSFLFKHIYMHLSMNGITQFNLYRLYFYDCPPLANKITYPISKSVRNFADTGVACLRNEFHALLRRSQKVCLRLGRLRVHEGNEWLLKSNPTEALIETGQLNDLTDKDFDYNCMQKGVDIQIGMDIAALSYERLVDKIVLITGDSDFVPALRLAREKGLWVTLDPMWFENIAEELNEHIDELRSAFPPLGGTEASPTCECHYGCDCIYGTEFTKK